MNGKIIINEREIEFREMYERKVTKGGNGATISIPKHNLGKKSIILIIEE